MPWRTRRRNRFIVGLIAAPLALGTLASCDDDGPAEEIGEDIDEAAEDAGEAIEDAADEVEDAVDDDGSTSVDDSVNENESPSADPSDG